MSASRVVLLPVLLVTTAAAGQPEGARLSAALQAAVRPALPFPEADRDGNAPGAASGPVWTVRWPVADAARVEVLANPSNPGNRARALKAEEEIQKAAMASQHRSQADYEQALRDFERTGKVGEIHEISLADEGIAGERYDAESQLTIRAEPFAGAVSFRVPTSRSPEPLPAPGGAAILRVPAHVYLESAADDPARTRFCPEQAWVFLGTASRPEVARVDAASVTIAAASQGPRGLVVSISGNAELVGRVLQQADWAPLLAYLAG